MRVAYAKAEDRLGDDENDVLITLGADPTPGVTSLKLFSRLNRPVCSPHYLAGKGSCEPLRGSPRADLLHDENRQGWQRVVLRGRTGQVDVGNGPVFADFNILATAVIAGHGVALCPVDVFRDELKRGDLVVLSDVSTNRDKSYFLTMSVDASPAALTFADWFRRAGLGRC